MRATGLLVQVTARRSAVVAARTGRRAVTLSSGSVAAGRTCMQPVTSLPSASFHSAAVPCASSSSAPSSSSFYSLPSLSAGVQSLLRGYSHLIPVQVAWSEQDIFGHVNNARYITYAESARIHWLSQLAAVTLTEPVHTHTGILSPADATAALPRAAGTFLSGRGGAGPILKSVSQCFRHLLSVLLLRRTVGAHWRISSLLWHCACLSRRLSAGVL